jgi:FtsH-binding integral membrane protein
MKWYHLKTFQLIILFSFIAIADAFTVAQKYFLPEVARPFSYLLFVVLVLLAFFFIVKPADPMVLVCYGMLWYYSCDIYY